MAPPEHTSDKQASYSFIVDILRRHMLLIGKRLVDFLVVITEICPQVLRFLSAVDRHWGVGRDHHNTAFAI